MTVLSIPPRLQAYRQLIRRKSIECAMLLSDLFLHFISSMTWCSYPSTNPTTNAQSTDPRTFCSTCSERSPHQSEDKWKYSYARFMRNRRSGALLERQQVSQLMRPQLRFRQKSQPKNLLWFGNLGLLKSWIHSDYSKNRSGYQSSSGIGERETTERWQRSQRSKPESRRR